MLPSRHTYWNPCGRGRGSLQFPPMRPSSYVLPLVPAVAHGDELWLAALWLRYFFLRICHGIDRTLTPEFPFMSLRYETERGHLKLLQNFLGLPQEFSLPEKKVGKIGAVPRSERLGPSAGLTDAQRTGLAETYSRLTKRPVDAAPDTFVWGNYIPSAKPDWWRFDLCSSAP